MFERLQQKWKVNGWRLLLILVTFAVGGSLCGYLGRLILNQLHISQSVIRIILYIVLVTILWPFCVILISIPTGQFFFFRSYLKKMGQRIAGRKTQAFDKLIMNKEGNSSPFRIAVFASGAGSNAAKIIEYFKGKPGIEIGLIVCNKPEAGVLSIAQKEGIPTLLLEKEKFFRGNAYVDELQHANISFIVLAGFLWKIPVALVQAFSGRIVNIHPALLPNYGGKGMYGMHVHNAVITAKEKESGITIHFVDEVYDHGAVIYQAICSITDTDTPETLAQKIHQLEHAHYPRVIEEVITGLQKRS
ncbi:phosphoribosylglycinamide formyltransferase [Pseudoflavitalea rhizosphaerae]|uniref:phosphoribosylglycinamide formyltransferase n=1 Tax=Pseudoflavitalea rhizosphaerae TaxID=1884793 RepID=UPI0030B9CD4D